MKKIITREEYFKYYLSDTHLQQQKAILEQYLPIKLQNIAYLKIFSNSSFILVTNQEWLENWLLHFNKFDTTLFNKKIQEATNCRNPIYCIWNYHIKDLLLEFNHNYQMNVGFDIYHRQKEYVEVLSISSENMEELYNYCINNLEYLHTIMHEMSLGLCDYRLEPFTQLDAHQSISKQLPGDTINTTGFALTEREMSCIRQIAKGYTMKTIGKQLNISPRTVETHINNIKLKTGCHYKSELIDFILNYR